MLDVVDITDRAEYGKNAAIPRLSAQHFSVIGRTRYYRNRPLAQFQELVQYVADFFLDRHIGEHYGVALFSDTESNKAEHQRRLKNAILVARTYWLNARSTYAFETLLPVMGVFDRHLTHKEAFAFMAEITAIIVDDFDAMLAHMADRAHERVSHTQEGKLGVADAIIPINHPQAFERGYACSERCYKFLTAEVRKLKKLILEREVALTLMPERESGLLADIRTLEEHAKFYADQTKLPTYKQWLTDFPNRIIIGDLNF